ncbi:MAG: ATP synthase F1 subunit delta [Pseudobdellovibrio sp.]
MSAESIIQKYSSSLFEVADEAKKIGVIGQELAEVAKIFTQGDALTFFNSPFNAVENKVTAAKASLEGRCQPEVFNFMIMLVQNERVAFVSEISAAYQSLLKAKSGETEGVLYVAGEASDAFKTQVEAKLSATLNKKVKLTVKKDSSLLSGYKVTVGGWTLDDSAQFHLNKIKEDISKRGI